MCSQVESLGKRSRSYFGRRDSELICQRRSNYLKVRNVRGTNGKRKVMLWYGRSPSLLKLWFWDQQHRPYHGVGWKCEIRGPDPMNQSLHPQVICVYTKCVLCAVWEALTERQQKIQDGKPQSRHLVVGRCTKNDRLCKCGHLLTCFDW